MTWAQSWFRSADSTLREGGTGAQLLSAAARRYAAALPVKGLRSGLKNVRRPTALMCAYIVLSLLAGIRAEEARALRWAHVHPGGDPAARSSVPPHMATRPLIRRELHAPTACTAREPDLFSRQRRRAADGSRAHPAAPRHGAG